MPSKIHTTQTIERDIWTFIADNFLLGEDVDLAAGTSLLEAGVLDSTGVMELVAFLEEEFEIEVADDELVPDNLDSVAKLTTYAAGKLTVETP